MAALTGDPILVTGAAGFIGFHLTRRLLENGCSVVGVDNLSPYYDPNLKKARLAQLGSAKGFRFVEGDISDRTGMDALFRANSFPYVVHLAAQVGVRHSLRNPHAYADSNLVGFVNILESCRHHGCRHLLYASTSSVYGANTKLPYSVHDNADHPLNLYAATKKANELMAHAYSHLFALPATGLRFFTVYGPWGRPDMAIGIFTSAILKGEPIKLFNHGRMSRDFTYVDDIVEAVARLIDLSPTGAPGASGEKPDPASSSAPWRIYNIGNTQPVELTRLVAILEKELGRTAKKEMLGLQAGDALVTCADIGDLVGEIAFRPSTPLEEGIRRFVAWFRSYYSV
jgi:UDP-glucuronate 4-epimerase